MNRFVVLYVAPTSVAERFAQATPQEAAKGAQRWTEWAQRIGPGIVEPGGPLANAKTVTTDGVANSDTKVIGMSNLHAASMNEALVMVKDHHHLHWADGCEIIILEEMAIPELAASV
jgi:hypothetical protein